MFKIKDKIICNKNNQDFFKMLIHFEILVTYTIFLIEKNNSKEIFHFYNYIFEQYIPEKVYNLDNIDYKAVFTGEYARESISIYTKLLELWKILQEKGMFDLEELDILKRTQKEIHKALKQI